MGRIRGTVHMRRYVFVLLVTTKFSGKSFVFKNNVAGKGLPKHDPSGLGAGGPRFKSGRPDQSFLLLTGISQKPFPALSGKLGGPHWIIPIFFSASCSCTARYFSNASTASTLQCSAIFA